MHTYTTHAHTTRMTQIPTNAKGGRLGKLATVLILWLPPSWVLSPRPSSLGQPVCGAPSPCPVGPPVALPWLPAFAGFPGPCHISVMFPAGVGCLLPGTCPVLPASSSSPAVSPASPDKSRTTRDAAPFQVLKGSRAEVQVPHNPLVRVSSVKTSHRKPHKMELGGGQGEHSHSWSIADPNGREGLDLAGGCYSPERAFLLPGRQLRQREATTPGTPCFLHNRRPSVPRFSLKSLPLRQPPVADGFATAFAIFFYSSVNPSVAGNITGIFIFQVYTSEGPTHPIFPLFPHVSCFPQKLWHHQEGLSPYGSLYNIFVQLGKRCPFFRILHFTLAEKHYNGLNLHLENCQDKYTNLQYRCHE